MSEAQEPVYCIRIRSYEAVLPERRLNNHVIVATKKTTKKLPPLKSMCFFLMAIAAFFIAFGAAGTLLNAIGIGGGKSRDGLPPRRGQLH